MLDVTIVADNTVLSKSHSLKVKYYDVKEIREAVVVYSSIGSDQV